MSTDLPIGTIIAWARPANAERVPEGWAICDGNQSPGNGQIQIPDLRGRFLRGSDTGTLPGNYGGEDMISGHTHSVQVGGLGFQTSVHTMGSFYSVRSFEPHTVQNPGIAREAICNDDSNRNHSHHGSIGSAVRDTEANGGHDNRPSFYSVIYIIKIR